MLIYFLVFFIGGGGFFFYLTWAEGSSELLQTQADPVDRRDELEGLVAVRKSLITPRLKFFLWWLLRIFVIILCTKKTSNRCFDIFLFLHFWIIYSYMHLYADTELKVGLANQTKEVHQLAGKLSQMPGNDLFVFIKYHLIIISSYFI